MPIHDWGRVDAGIFHDFHVGWIAAIRDVLNNGGLPADYYAFAEQIAGSLGPDVLTLQANGAGATASPTFPVMAVSLWRPHPAKVRFTASTMMDEYVLKQKTLVIRHYSDDRIIALVEIVSPGNKASRHAPAHSSRRQRTQFIADTTCWSSTCNRPPGGTPTAFTERFGVRSPTRLTKRLGTSR